MRPKNLVLLLCVCILGLISSGCAGPHEKQLLSGTVTNNGEPVNATVKLYSYIGDDNSMASMTTGQDGHYSLTVDGGADVSYELKAEYRGSIVYLHHFSFGELCGNDTHDISLAVA
jgi:hypothetical protein